MIDEGQNDCPLGPTYPISAKSNPNGWFSYSLLQGLIVTMRKYSFNAILLMAVMGLALIWGGQSTASAADPEPAGWYAGDMHVHRSCGGPPDSIEDLHNMMSVNDLAVISLLADMGNGEVQNPVTDLPLVNGQNASISTPGRMVHWDAEWHWDAVFYDPGVTHHALGGHIVALGLTEADQVWEEYTFPIIDWAHQRSAIAGFVHMQYLDNDIPQSLNCCIPIEYPVEVALGSADFIAEDVQGGDTAIQAYYRLLNTGFRPGFAAGTDYPCGVSELGSLLTYVQVAGGVMTYGNWIAGIKNGRTVISRNGHNEFLNLTVNGSATPGDEVKLTGAGSVPVTVTWTANQDLTGTIELVHNGLVVAHQDAAVSPGVPAGLTTTVAFGNSGWLVARRMDGNGHVVHTGAVFVIVNNAPIRASEEDANFYVAWMDNLLTKTALGGEWRSYFPTKLNEARARYQAAKAIYEQIALEAAGQLHINTSSLASGAQGVPYGAGLSASGGTPPYAWSLNSGSDPLPPGLSLSSTGAISGTPAASGTFPFTVRVTDASNPQQIATKILSITIAAPTLISIAVTPANPTIQVGATRQFTATGTYSDSSTQNLTGSATWASSNTGVATISSAGLAMAMGVGSTSISARVGGVTGSTMMTVSPATLIITTSSLATGTQNTVYSANLAASGGTLPYSWSLAAGSGPLPTGLTLSSSGAISGTPTATGVFSFKVRVTDSGNPVQNAEKDLSITIAAPTLLSIAVTPANPTSQVGSTRQFTATGTYSDSSTQNLTGSATWASTNTGVATINSAGLAAAVTVGSTTVSATLNAVTGSTTLTVSPATLTVTTSSLARGIRNVAYLATLSAAGGTFPYNWSRIGGTLPAGLTLSGSGAISGTPTATGVFSFKVRVTDSGNPVKNAEKDLGITIEGPRVYLPLIKK
jgi:hypothetical protein